MASSPPRCTRFNNVWSEPFAYSVGGLIGQGPWVDAIFPQQNPHVYGAGSVGSNGIDNWQAMVAPAPGNVHPDQPSIVELTFSYDTAANNEVLNWYWGASLGTTMSVQLVAASGNASTLDIFFFDPNGAGPQISAVPCAAGVRHTLRVEVTADNCTMYLDGSQIGSAGISDIGTISFPNFSLEFDNDAGPRFRLHNVEAWNP